MKKFLLVLLALVAVFALVSCKKDNKKDPAKHVCAHVCPTCGKCTDENCVDPACAEKCQGHHANPTITGVEDKEIVVGSKFNPLEGVHALDAEGNDITEDIEFEDLPNPNVIGVYHTKYMVTDKWGGKAEALATFTVVAVDETAPLITGAGNISVIYGGTFDPKAGVTALDTKDGDVTDKITISGDTVNMFKLGDYTVTYKVSDAAGNQTTLDRKVTVGLGAFLFKEADKVENATVTAEINPEAIYKDFGLLQVNYTVTVAEDATEAVAVSVKLGDAVVDASHAASGTYSAYFRYTAKIEAVALEITGATFANYIVGDACDNEAPVFTGEFTKAVPISGDHKEAAAQLIIDMTGAKAQDNRDGFVTANITADLEGLDLTSKEEQTVYLKVSDLAGNEATQAVKVIVNKETELADLAADLAYFAAEGKFGAEAEHANYWRNFDSLAKVTEEGKDKDAYKIGDIAKSGGYWSFSMIRFDLASIVTEGNYYVIKITARAGLEESEGQATQGISYRIGAQLAADPWYYEFVGCSVAGSTYAENRMNLTSEYQTIYRIFKADTRIPEEDMKAEPYSIAMEFHLSEQNYNTVYPVYIKEFSVSLLSNEDQAPQLFVDSSLPTVIVTGSDVNLDSYVTATDVEDGALTVTHTGTIGTEAGYYEITYSATDSKEHTVTKTIKFEVLSEADTVAPVITFAGENPMEIVVDSTTEDALTALLASKLSIKDHKNGADQTVALDDPNVTISGSVDPSKAGKYKLTVSAKDSSGNSSSLDIIIRVVKDNEPASQYELVADLMDGFNGTKENLSWELVDDVLVFTADDPIGEYGSVNKSKLEKFIFEVGKTYHFEVEAKADAARKVVFSWATAESSWSKYGSAGKITAELGTEFEKFSVDFTYTGKFTVSDVEYDVAYYALEIQLGHIDNGAGETPDNKVYVKSMNVYEVNEQPTEQVELVADLMDGFNGTKENLSWELADDVLVFTADDPIGEYGSVNKSKLEKFIFEVGKTYRFEVEAKADAARKVVFSWATAESSWSKYGSAGKITAELGTEFEKFSVDFTYTGKFTVSDVEYDVAYYALEIQLGHIDNGAGETPDNKVYVKSMNVYEVTEAEQAPKEIKPFTLDFEDKTENADVPVDDANWAAYKLVDGELVKYTGVQQRYRGKGDVRVINMAAGYGNVNVFKYTDGNKMLAQAITDVEINLGNYFGGAQEMKFCVVLFDKDGNEVYVIGDNIDMETMSVTTDAEPFVKFTGHLDKPMDVYGFAIINVSEMNGNGYLYLDYIKLFKAPKPFTLDFEDKTENADVPVDDANWAAYKLVDGELVKYTGVQQRYRGKDDVRVINMAAGYGNVNVFKYTDGNKMLGEYISEVEVNLGNYFGGAQEMKFCVVLFDKDGNEVYVIGDNIDMETMSVTTDAEPFVKFTGHLDKPMDVYGFAIIDVSAMNGNGYLYLDYIALK